MTYYPIPTTIEGNKKQADTSDDDAIQLLTEILKELKIMNLHLSLMTDINIQKQDIGD